MSCWSCSELPQIYDLSRYLKITRNETVALSSLSDAMALVGGGRGNRRKTLPIENRRKRLSINKIFTEDLLVEILHRLPCESAVRCKAVCKQWRSLISSRYFLNRYHSHHEEEEFMVDSCFCKAHLFLIPRQYQHRFSFDCVPFFEKDRRNSFVRGYCRGLFLCTPDKLNQIFYYICNPITKQCVSLPPSPPHTFKTFVGLACLDRSFKVVRLSHPLESNPLEIKPVSEFEVDVYSSQTGQWTHMTVPSPKLLSWFRYPSLAVFYRGFLHWIAWDGFKTIVYDVSRNSIPFIIGRPKEVAADSRNCPLQGLGLCRGLLWVAQLYNTTLRIWQLKYTSSKKQQRPEWCLKHCLSLQETILKNSHKPRVLAIHPFDPNIVYLGIDQQDVLSCDMRTKTLEFVYKFPTPPIDRFSIGCFSWFHTYSLTPPFWPSSIPEIHN